MSENERIQSGYAALADNENGSPVQVSGVAFGEGDVTRGASGKETYWPREVLEDAADALEGVPLATPGDHTADDPQPQTPPEDVVGEVTWSGYKPGVGIVWEGELADEALAEKVESGYLDVSPQLYRDITRHSGDEAAYKGEKIHDFRDLTIVSRGASKSNEITVGENPMKAEALHETVEALRESGVEALKEVAGVEFTGTADGTLDESEIPNDADFGNYYLYPGENKSESSYPVVDSEGRLRRGNVDAAWQLGARGGVDEDEHDRRLMELAAEFENPPDWASDEEAMMGAQVEDPALWEACSLSVPVSLVDDSGGNPETDPGSDDGENGSSPQSSAGADTVQETNTMTNDELTDSEKAILSAAESVEEPTEALEQFAAADNPKLVEQDTYEALNNAVETLDGMMAEALTEEFGLRESAVEAMSFEAKAAQFENDEGEFEAEALVQEPETGDPEESGGGVEALSDEEKTEAKNLMQSVEALGAEAPSSSKERVAELVGEESYEDAKEVLN